MSNALFRYIKNTYNNPVVYILGIGLLDDTGVINDQNRVEYLQKHFQQAALSVSVDLVKLVGLTSDYDFMFSFESQSILLSNRPTYACHFASQFIRCWINGSTTTAT